MKILFCFLLKININLYELYYIDTIFEFARNKINGKKIAVKKIINLMGKTSFKDTLNNIKNKLFFKSLINKIMSCKYISNEYKQQIRKEIFQNKF